MWKRNCPNPDNNPNCEKELSYSTKGNRNYAERRNTNCHLCAMKSEKTRKKMSDSHKGKSPWNKGKTGIYSEEVLKNWRLSALKRIEKNKFNGGQMTPGYNSEACKIIDEYNKKYGFNFRHAENGGEICIDGYWPDGLDEKRKTIIEIDENHHFNSDGTYRKKDIQRQRYLEDLGYKFIRVRK